MFRRLSNKLSSKSSTNHRSASNRKANHHRNRWLGMESLERRELMSASPLATGKPDLAVTDPRCSVWESAVVGSQVAWYTAVQNVSKTTDQTGNYTVKWWLSLDQKLSSNDIFVTSVCQSGGLKAGKSVGVQQIANVPSGVQGQYNVIAEVVNAADANSSNNVQSISDTDWFGTINRDNYEGWFGNDSTGSATPLGTIPRGATFRPTSSTNLNSATDTDYYKFTFASNGTKDSQVRIDFANRVGDLKLTLYNSNGQPILYSPDGSGDSEVISLNGLAGTFFVKVASSPRPGQTLFSTSRTYKQDVSPVYTLTIVGPGATYRSTATVTQQTTFSQTAAAIAEIPSGPSATAQGMNSPGQTAEIAAHASPTSTMANVRPGTASICSSYAETGSAATAAGVNLVATNNSSLASLDSSSSGAPTRNATVLDKLFENVSDWSRI